MDRHAPFVHQKCTFISELLGIGVERGAEAHLYEEVGLDAAQYEYLWADNIKVKRPIRLAAQDYTNALFDWIEAQVGPLPQTPAAPRCGELGGSVPSF
jgi:hypothetical protein